jgi:cysteine synthase/predicted thioesterase
MLESGQKTPLDSLKGLCEALNIKTPEDLDGCSPEILVEEVKERLLMGSETDRRALIHFPQVLEMLTLENGSKIMAIDFTTIPGNTSKVVPMDDEFKKAEESGEVSLEETPTLIVHSSGNASIWFTEIARRKGYKVMVVTFDYISTPRIDALTALGAEIYFIQGEKGVEGAIEKAKELERTHPGSKFLDQTHSEDNYKSFIPHGRRAVRKLLLKNLPPTHFVSGVGTGGTFTGLSMGVRELAPDCDCVAVEIGNKPHLSKKYPDSVLDIDSDSTIANLTQDEDLYWTEEFNNSNQIPGLAANIDGINLTELFETAPSSITSIRNATAFKATRLLGRNHQRFVGPSTGAAFAAAYTIANQNPNSVVLMPICDDGFRYEGDIWHKQKYQVSNSELLENKIGSSIEIQSHVYQDSRTPHLAMRERGGPYSTDAMLYFMEMACRELEKKMGLIDDENESLGMGVIDLKHLTSIPLGTEIKCKAKLVEFSESNGKKFLTYETQAFAVNDNQEIPISGTAKHQRCVMNLDEFRKKQQERFPDSVI